MSHFNSASEKIISDEYIKVRKKSTLQACMWEGMRLLVKFHWCCENIDSKQPTLLPTQSTFTGSFFSHPIDQIVLPPTKMCLWEEWDFILLSQSYHSWKEFILFNLAHARFDNKEITESMASTVSQSLTISVSRLATLQKLTKHLYYLKTRLFINTELQNCCHYLPCVDWTTEVQRGEPTCSKSCFIIWGPLFTYEK